MEIIVNKICVHLWSCVVGSNLKDKMAKYIFYQISFTLMLLCLPCVFIKCTLISLIVFVLLWTIQKLWRSYMDTKINTSNRAILVTGCDTGLGFAFAKRLDELQFTVFAGCLNSESDGAKTLRDVCSDRLRVIQLDVTDDNSVADAFIQIEKSLPENGLWGIVNNAGINSFGDVELTPVSLYGKLFNVNLYGPVRVLRQFLCLVRRSKGRVVNITSVHGRMALPEQSNYEVAKHGIETLSDSLRLEMKKFGVKVSIVEPGLFGRCTSIQNQSVIKRQSEEIEEMWRSCSSQVKETYSKDYMLSWLPKSNETWPPNDGDISPVLQAVEHALCSTSPQYRYLVDGYGKNISYIDEYGVLARICNILPTWITDACVTKIKNCYKKVK